MEKAQPLKAMVGREAFLITLILSQKSIHENAPTGLTCYFIECHVTDSNPDLSLYNAFQRESSAAQK
jgi:hypothetical protein